MLVALTGTDTEMGKTWVGAALARRLAGEGRKVSARKPVQSFSPVDTATDADILGAATGEPPKVVCPAHRWYPVPIAPPMAAANLGVEVPTLASLVTETMEKWPPPDVEIGLIEGAGGVASPLAADGHNADLARAIGVDLAVLVAHSGLGTINAVRLCAAALAPLPVTVYLNWFDPTDDLHSRNRDWLAHIDGLHVITSIEKLTANLVDLA